MNCRARTGSTKCRLRGLIDAWAMDIREEGCESCCFPVHRDHNRILIECRSPVSPHASRVDARQRGNHTHLPSCPARATKSSFHTSKPRFREYELTCPVIFSVGSVRYRGSYRANELNSKHQPAYVPGERKSYPSIPATTTSPRFVRRRCVTALLTPILTSGAVFVKSSAARGRDDR